jgi:hypothetical protein
LFPFCFSILTFRSLKLFSPSFSHLSLGLPTFSCLLAYFQKRSYPPLFDSFWSHTQVTPTFSFKYLIPDQEPYIIPSVLRSDSAETWLSYWSVHHIPLTCLYYNFRLYCSAHSSCCTAPPISEHLMCCEISELYITGRPVP